MHQPMAQASGSDTGSQREKKTRRRLRLSCVECTKRRQKCDRKYPCSLCISRGVAHLCRWESVPVARPTPQRPPVVPFDPTVQELVARIAALEKELEEQKIRAKVEPMSDAFSSSPSGSSTFTGSTDVMPPSIPPSPGSQSFGHPYPPPPLKEDERVGKGLSLTHEVFTTTSALAQLAFGHHGEYVGRGSFICALHAFTPAPGARYLYATSTNATSAYQNWDTSLGLSSIPPAEREKLIQALPPRSIAVALIHDFFAHHNWRYGIPEQWFQTACTQMWTALEYPNHCNLQTNANWLSLFFSMLAIAASTDDSPQPDGGGGMESTEIYFKNAMSARRIAEDDYFNKPTVSVMVSAADGTVLGCLAVPLLCSYLTERGRVSEAWKLVGSGIRHAEAVGMHRDPEWIGWQVMSKDEIDMRRIAWWDLVILDKTLSCLLGRPPMVIKDIVNVAIPPYIEPDGSKNHHNRSLALLVQLTDIVQEMLEKCVLAQSPRSSSVVFELDEKYQRWEDNLPPEYWQDRDEQVMKDLARTELMFINQHRYCLLTWYLMCRTKLHLSAITGFGRSIQPWADVTENPKRCIIYTMRQMRLQFDAHAASLQYKVHSGNHWLFEGCISLAEATVVLMIILTRFPWKEKTREAVELVDRAMAIFTHIVSKQKGKQGEIARMAEKVVGALREEDWWKSQSISVAIHGLTTTLQGTPGDTKPFNTKYDSQWYPGNLHSGSFQSHSQYIHPEWDSGHY